MGLVAFDDGSAASCCIAWPDPVSAAGNFEPVATHPAFARRGFATIVMTEGMWRLRDAGMRRVIVRTPLGNDAAEGLYRSLGFCEKQVLRAYGRRVPI